MFGLPAAAALLLAAAPSIAVPQGVPDPCAAARTPVPRVAAEAMADAAVEVESYRRAWRNACDPARGAADLAGLVGDAEALVGDARIGRVVRAMVRTIPEGAAWPLPAIRRADDDLEVDWAAFAAMAERGTAEDRRFFRGHARTVRVDGEPVWLGPRPEAAREPCLALAGTSFVEIALGLEEMERAQVESYARRGAALREELGAALGAVAAGRAVCACVRGDPLPALDALASALQGRGTPERRALLKVVSGAAEALRSGRARVSWLREAPGAEPTGCGAGPR